jgi:dimethylaniline monooxygenase (N-oxide forming)
VSGFPDVQFKLPEDAPRYHDLFESKYLTQYLEDYIVDQKYDGRGLGERFVFNCWVRHVRKEGSLWVIDAKLDDEDIQYKSTKIIIATGLDSQPQMPHLHGREEFEGPVLHQKDFGKSGIFTDAEADPQNHINITVLGGSKSAADIVYAAATDTNHPRKVNWIIRTDGTGPIVLVDAKAFGKYRATSELGSIRALSNLSAANPYLPETWFSWFLHKTIVGQWLLNFVWSQNENKSISLANYKGREGALPGFEKLLPEGKIQWRSGPMGMLQKDDYWDVIAKNVQVYRGDVRHLEKDTVVLEDGTKVRTDVLLCATGWKQQHPYFDADDAARIGLPIKPKEKELVQEEWQHWSKLDEEADRKVLARWPYLASVPQFRTYKVTTTPYRLYKNVIPPNDPSIAFLGLEYVPNSYHVAAVQAIYAIAILDGCLQLPPQAEMEKDIAFIDRWCARRYPVHGWQGNVLDYEMLSYTDHLLEEMGLSSHRPRTSWWRDLTDPCLASDYAGLVDEYRKKYLGGVVQD